jgi:hypothetical protein
MPLDNDSLLGTEKDGSLSRQYCKYCYQGGAFINPDMTLEEMAALIKEKMQEMNLRQDIIANTIRGLPYLNRWIRTKSNA